MWREKRSSHSLIINCQIDKAYISQHDYLPKNWPHEGKEKRMNKMLDIGHVGLVHDNAAHRVIETSKEGYIRDILAGQ